MQKWLVLAIIAGLFVVLAGCATPTEPPPFATAPPPTKTDTPIPPTATPYPVTLEPGKEPLVLAAVSMDPAMDTEQNRETMALYMEQARTEGAHLVVFPGFALQSNPCYGFDGFDPTDEAWTYFRETAETIPGPSTDWLVEKANEIGIYCAFGMTEVAEDGQLYNSCVLLGPAGVLAVQRQYDLGSSMNGGQLFSAGSTLLTVAETPLGRVGLTMDMGERESGQANEVGPDLLIALAAWPTRWSGFYTQFARQEAAQAHLWLAVANDTGRVGDVLTCGQSMIVSPAGPPAAYIGSEEGMAIAQTDVLVDSALFGGG